MLLKLKLGNPVGCHRRKAFDGLQHILHQVNRAKTASELAWLRYREGEKVLVMHTGGSRSELSIDQDPKYDLNKICWPPKYGIARHVAPDVGAQIMSCAYNAVLDRLKGKVPYTAKAHQYRWQALLNHDGENLAIYRGRSFAVPKQSFAIAWKGVQAGDRPKNLARQSMELDQALFAAQLWSKESGREKLSVTFRLVMRRMSSGHRTILMAILNPNHYFKACDSSLNFRDGQWYLHLVYKDSRTLPKLECVDGAGLVVQCNRWDAKSGFVLTLPDKRKRYVGPDRSFVQQYHELQSRREFMKRSSAPGRHGRGVRKHLQRAVEITRGLNFLQDRMLKKWIADIIRTAKQSRATWIDYREPTLGHGVRSKDWFAHHGVNWCWAKFAAELKAKCEHSSVRLGYRSTRENLTTYRARVNEE